MGGACCLHEGEMKHIQSFREETCNNEISWKNSVRIVLVWPRIKFGDFFKNTAICPWSLCSVRVVSSRYCVY
jgi:hypothetical protein